MATPVIESAFTTGEVSPALFGNISLTRMHAAAATLRNFFVRYSGGAYSRAGTEFVGFSKQTGRQYPPRLITFQFSINQGLALEFGNFYMRVILDGAFVLENPISIISISNSSPARVTVSGAPFANGDWVYISNAAGMVQIDNQTYVIGNVSGGNFSLYDVYGNPIDTTGFAPYGGGGVVSRIYTLSTIYSEADLEYLKFTQSADVMSICCVNQQTSTEYTPQDLARFSDTNWVFTPAIPASTISPPTAVTLTGTAGTTTSYAYSVTAVSPVDGTESVASVPGTGTFIDIASTAGSIEVAWTAVLGVSQYNVYKATPSNTGAVPVAVQFGYAGTSYGVIWIDNNIVSDFTQVPPFQRNPFARGSITAINPVTVGSGYDNTTTVSITSVNGGGAIVQPIVNNGVVAFLIENGGSGFAPGDTAVISGIGTGAKAAVVVGPETGTYPGVVAYFQQRRAYAATLNQPDTYFMSQPGSFTNFDSRVPPIATDAITGTPWSEEVNGIQFMVPVSGGLIAMTGLEAYLVTGVGGNVFSPQPLTPSSQQAQPEGFNGCSPTIPPIRIYQDILYVQAKGSTYRDFAFDISTYTYTGVDLTLNSSHLFVGHTFREHAWCEEPFKVLWAVRDDGVLLSLTYQKSEKVAGWGRHDTNGQFVSVCSVTEPPIDALYTAVNRPIGGSTTTYTVERMNGRIWDTIEDAWCVDCGFSLPQPEPNATLAVTTGSGLGAVTGTNSIIGGSGYSVGTTATVVDAPLQPNGAAGPGAGAVPTLTIVGGQITAVTFAAGQQGQGYLNPQLVLYDPAGSEGGSGASAQLTLQNTATLISTPGVFSPLNVGSVIRTAGGVAVVTVYISPTQVTANILSPIAAVQANSSGFVQPQTAGNWTMTAPVQTLNGLLPLARQTVTGLADGVVITPRVVSSTGQIILDKPASQVTIGLAFQAQLQSVYLDAGEPTVQGQRKKVGVVTARVEASGVFLVGSNQPDGSTLSPIQVAPTWNNLAPAVTGSVPAYNSVAVPMYTGDIRIPVQGGFQRPGQVCIQQDLPLPVQILALISESLEGDNPAQAAPSPQK